MSWLDRWSVVRIWIILWDKTIIFHKDALRRLITLQIKQIQCSVPIPYCTAATREQLLCVSMHFSQRFSIILCHFRQFYCLYSPLSVCCFAKNVHKMIYVIWCKIIILWKDPKTVQIYQCSIQKTGWSITLNPSLDQRYKDGGYFKMMSSGEHELTTRSVRWRLKF